MRRTRNRRILRAFILGLFQRKGFAMHIFQIKQTSSGAVLWTGNASDERSALDAMAREAGYAHFDALPASIRSAGVVAKELTSLS